MFDVTTTSILHVIMEARFQ